MILTIWHSGKGKTTKRVQDQWLPGISEERETNKQSEHRGFLGQ